MDINYSELIHYSAVDGFKEMTPCTNIYCRMPFLRAMWVSWILGTYTKFISPKISGNSIVTQIAE